MELSHCLVGITTSFDKVLVAVFKLFTFLVRVIKSLCNADTGNAALKRCIDNGDGLSGMCESFTHAVL